MPFKKALVTRAPFPVTFNQQVAVASLLTTLSLFANPPGAIGAGGGEYYEVTEIEAWFDVASSSGTLDVRGVGPGAAATAGNSLLTGTISLAAGARTAIKGAMTTTRTNRLIAPGGTVSVILGGVLTNLVGFSVTVWLQAMRGIRSR